MNEKFNSLGGNVEVADIESPRRHM